MPMLDRREQALEEAFAHDAEVRFLMLTHRNKLFGRWAADLLQYRGEAAEDYVRLMVDAIGTPPGGVQTPDDKIVSRVLNDFVNSGLVASPGDVRGALLQFEEESKDAFRTRAA